jgi:membrane protein implicated in regulation of membrane protease activity
MSAVAGTFLAIGGFSLVLLVLSLFGGGRLHLGHLHIGHFHIGHLHLGHGHIGHVQGSNPAGGHGIDLSLPVISGFLGTFGFGGAIVASLLPGGSGTWLAATVVGLVAAVPAAWLAGRMMRAAMNMSTDATLTSQDLLGALGVVISPVPNGGLGEVRLAIAGQQMKFYARSDQPLALGTRVFVISVPTPTSVLVEPTPTVE